MNDALKEEIRRIWQTPGEAEGEVLRAYGLDQVVDDPIEELIETGLSLPTNQEHLFEWSKSLLSRMRASISAETLRRLNESRDLLHQKICVEFRYCERRKEGAFEGDEATIAIGVAESLISAAADLGGVPVASLSVYLIKRRILDEFCDCD